MARINLISLNCMILCQLIITTINAENPKTILKKSYHQCQLVRNGYYEMIKYMKYPTSSDTTIIEVNGYFKKLIGDTLCSSAFHYLKYSNLDYLGECIYTGDEYIVASNSDSSINIYNKSISQEELKLLLRQNGLLYYPFTNIRSFPFFKVNGNLDNDFDFENCGIENINNFSCYHIKISIKKNHIQSIGIEITNIEFNYWIDMKSLLPMQFTSLTNAIYKGESVNQFEKFILRKYELNIILDDSLFKLQSVPSYYKI